MKLMNKSQRHTKKSRHDESKKAKMKWLSLKFLERYFRCLKTIYRYLLKMFEPAI